MGSECTGGEGWDMIAILVATVFGFTTPAFNAAPDSCSPGLLPLNDLALVRLYGRPQGGGDTLLAERGGAAPGARDSFDVVLDARPWNLWAVAVDSTGNESCRGDALQVNGQLAVDPPPAGLWLGAPRPNPTRGLVAVPFCLPEAGTVSLEVFDVQGRRVALLTRGRHAAGVHISLWNSSHAEVGLYLVRLRTGGWHGVSRLLVIR